jgi:branched-chain amino acid transport system permease protein
MLAGAAGVMFGLLFSQIFHFMGFLAGLKGFTAAVVGGIGSIPGAMLGGILVGLAEAYATGYFGGRWSDLIVFGILIFVLLVRPSGLLGTRAIQKV